MEHSTLIKQVWPQWEIDRTQQPRTGSYGVVYKAVRRDYDFESNSAIKIIPVPRDRAELDSLKAEGLTDAETDAYFKSIVDDFTNEIKLMESFKGARNIVSVEDYRVLQNEEGPGWYILIRMEFLTPLPQYLSSNSFTEKDVARIGADICTALEQCAQWNVIHRDIKPANIFVNRFGDFKLGDFGIARSLENAANGMSKRYTPDYMAPEIEYSPTYDSRVDIYSLGIVLYRLLNNNRLPFQSSPPNATTAQEREDAKRRRLVGEAMPPPCNASREMASIILCACAHDPNRRFGTATAMKRALQDFIDGKITVDNGNNATVSVSPSSGAAGAAAYHGGGRAPADRGDKTVSVAQPSYMETPQNYPANGYPSNYNNCPPNYQPQQGRADLGGDDGYGGKRRSKLPILLAALIPLALLTVLAVIMVPKLIKSPVNGGKDASNNNGPKQTAPVGGAQASSMPITSEPPFYTTTVPSIDPQTTASALDNDRINVIVAEVDALAAVGDYQGALSRIQSALVIYPTSERLLNKESELLRIIAAMPPQTAAPTAAYVTQVPITPVPTPVYVDPTVPSMSYECYGIDVGHEHIIALKSDGTVLAAGINTKGQCDVSSWRNIIEVAAGYTFSAGLQSDGRVVLTGSDSFGKIDASAVSQWRNIVHISAHGCGLIALDKNGNVFVTGCNSETGEPYSVDDSNRSLHNAVAVSAGNEHMLILLSDGTCRALGNRSDAMCNVSSWRNIVSIAAAAGGSIGVNAAGDVLYTGVNNHNQYAYTGLRDIAAVASKGWHMVYITKSGYVGALGWSDSGRCNTSGWNNLPNKHIVGIAASAWNNLVLFDDGTVMLSGHPNLTSKVNISSWRGIVKTR